MADDFGSLDSEPGKKRQRMQETHGEQRVYLKVYETLPCQLLNAYGMAKYPKLSDSAAWAAMCEPLKSGASFMTEYASPLAERRGIAVNRWLQCVLEFCQYQKTTEVQKQNTCIMQEKIRKELYVEIERILPALEYCLAPKKAFEPKKGACMLRSAARPLQPAERQTKDREQLDRYAKELYEWMDTSRVSRIRMMLQWQGGGGLPYVASVHHRATQCFRYQGNSKHEAGKSKTGVSLEEWQEAVRERHRVGSSGIDEGQAEQSVDFNS